MADSSAELAWSIEEVGAWIEELGFPMYKACFVSNFVAGKDLPTVNASKLPKLGVTDHKHIGVISKAIRDKFGLLEPDWGRSVADVMWSPQNSLEGCAEGYGQGNTRAPAIDPTPRWQQIQQEQAQQA